ncbi:Atrial natriuretic peptide receptor 2 [Hypsibius exemplaris]|uniref:guanylate cyclase n=1 Tax=Hypsibius exemplaris TaxID=2072580 RepID=A0A1W0WU94_HYPEX|nr:Atrial natriuretic peptide receptor 2 [Hypsibius exemplaris]
MHAVIDQALLDAEVESQIKFINTNPKFYSLSASNNTCDDVNVFSAVRGVVDLLAEGSGSLFGSATNLVGRMMVGPDCAETIKAATLLVGDSGHSSIQLSGRAELLYSVRDVGMIVRTSYSVYNIWYIFRKMAMEYNWTRFTALYDTHDKGSSIETVPGLHDAFQLMVRGGLVYGFAADDPRNRPSIPNATLEDVVCDLGNPPSATGERPAPPDANVTECLKNAKAKARIIILLMKPVYVRQFLIAAKGMNMTNSEYLYITTDFDHTRFINPPVPAWQQNDASDPIAKEAFRSLFVIGLDPFYETSEYQTLESKLKARGVQKMNYFYAAFYDAIMLYAAALRYTADDDDPVLRGYVANAATRGCNNFDPTNDTDSGVHDGDLDFTSCRTILHRGQFLLNAPLKTRNWTSGRLWLDSYADRISYLYLYAITDTQNGIYRMVAYYDPRGDKEIPGYGREDRVPYLPGITPDKPYFENQQNPIPWIGGAPTKSRPDCGYDGTEGPCQAEVPVLIVSLCISMTFLCVLIAVGYRYHKLAKVQAKTDREWIAHGRALSFQRHKRNEFSDDSPENYVDEKIPLHDGSVKDTEDGHSMGRSMGASIGRSMGQSMTGSMKRKFTMMGEHFGTWNRTVCVIRWTNRKKVSLTPQLIKDVRLVRKLDHENVAKFIGSCLEEDCVCVLYEMCEKGPLNLQFEGEAKAKLDWAIRLSWIKDIVSGMIYIHDSPVGPHTRLTSHCCFIDSRFVVKITDYGLPTLFTITVAELWMDKRNAFNANSQLWTCPEVIRADAEGVLEALRTKERDVYSFGIILQEIILRARPYSMYAQPSSAIIDEIRRGTMLEGKHFRPLFPKNCDAPAGLINLAQQCWAEDPTVRPLFDKVATQLRDIMRDRNMGEHTNVMDVFMQQMEETSHQLEVTVQEKEKALARQEVRSDEAYLEVFPKDVAELVMNFEDVEPILYQHATLLITDVVGFETLCTLSSPPEIIQLLEDYYKLLSAAYCQFKCFKIDHAGDTVLVTSGVSGESGRQGAKEIARLALRLMVEAKQFTIHYRPTEQLKLRIGVASGPLVMSVLQLTAPRYAICGNLLQTVRRLLVTSECLKIHVSASTKHLLDSYMAFQFKQSSASPVPVSHDSAVQSFWLVNEEGNAELKARRMLQMEGLDIKEDEL